MAYQLQEINRRIQTDVAEFLAECDENYAQRVSLAADKILSNLEHSPIVLLSGPSGSGKTTTAMKIAEELRRRGGDKGEFGATTGRPRRVGWFDTVATKYGCMVQGATQVALTCLDVMGYLDEIKVCVGYEIDGEVTDQFPTTPKLMGAKPVFETLPGWQCDVRGVTDYDVLPANAKAYVEFLEGRIGVPITIVSTGPKRHEIALRK